MFDGRKNIQYQRGLGELGEMTGGGTDWGAMIGNITGGLITAAGSVAGSYLGARAASRIPQAQPITALPVVTSPQISQPVPNNWPWIMGVAGIGAVTLIAVTMLTRSRK